MDQLTESTSASGEEIVTLNVGGQIFQTTSTTLLMGTRRTAPLSGWRSTLADHVVLLYMLQMNNRCLLPCSEAATTSRG